MSHRLNEEASRHYSRLSNEISNLIKQSEDKGNTINKQTFYLWQHNMTNIQLFKMEETLSNKGSKCNMGIVPKKCMKQLVCKTENAIRQVSISQREVIRHIATKKHTTNYIKTKHNK